MTETKTVSVDAEELRAAFEFVSSGAPLEHRAYICLDTGRIYWGAESAGLNENDLPDDLETSDRYIAVPHKNDRGLGRRLALTFAGWEMPDSRDIVAGFFRRRGAYARFKDLLASRGLLRICSRRADCCGSGTRPKTERRKRLCSPGVRKTAFSHLASQTARGPGDEARSDSADTDYAAGAVKLISARISP